MGPTGALSYDHHMGPTAAGRRRHLLAALAATALAATACSGGDDATPTTTAALAPATTTAPPPTTAPPTTAAATTAAPPTTAPPTTEPPPPTTPPPTTTGTIDVAAAEPAVTQLMIDYIAAVNALNRDPANETLRTALAGLASGYPLDLFIERADELVLDNRFSRVDPANPSRVEPIPLTFSFAPSEPVVAMDGCVIDTDSQVSRGADGVEQVTESTPDSVLLTFTFTNSNGRWIVTDLVTVQQYQDQIGCE